MISSVSNILVASFLRGWAYLRPVIIPWSHLLIGIRGLEYQVIAVPGTDYLKARGQAIFGETCRHASGRMPGEVEGIGKGHCSEQGDGVPINIARWRAFGGKGLSGHGGGKEEVELVKEITHDSVQLSSDFLGLKEIFYRKGLGLIERTYQGSTHLFPIFV
jgi:hypothetical protein